MEKRNYVKPLLNSEEFVPQTYVAACVAGGYTQYSFICNAGKGTTRVEYTGWNGNKYYRDEENHWKVYLNTGEQVGFNYHPCDTKHVVNVPLGTDVNTVFKPGYMDNKLTEEVEHVNVYVWRGTNNDNCHCMVTPGSTDIELPKQMS